MTVGAWIVFIILALFIIGCGAISGLADGEPLSVVVGILVGIIISGAILGGMLWYFNSTAAGARALKTQESNFNNGINRRVAVYDMEGDIIQEYEGKFDIEYDDDRILFDDEKGLRHVIYYPTGTIIIEGM